MGVFLIESSLFVLTSIDKMIFLANFITRHSMIYSILSESRELHINLKSTNCACNATQSDISKSIIAKI